MSNLRTCYVARCKCGCRAIVAGALNDHTDRPGTAAFVGDLIRSGYDVELLPVDEARAMSRCRKVKAIKWPNTILTVKQLVSALRAGFELRALPLFEVSKASAGRPFKIFKDGVVAPTQILDRGIALAAAYGERAVLEHDRTLDDGSLVFRLKASQMKKAKRVKA